MSYKQSNNPQSAICNPQSQAGSATLELSLLSPLLILMLLGSIDFARLFYDGITVANAARAGVQYGALSKSKSGDINGMVQAAMNDVEDLYGVSVTAERYCACSDGSRVDCVNGDCSLLEGKPQIYVKVTVQKTFETLFPYPGIPHTLNLRREAIMRAR